MLNHHIQSTIQTVLMTLGAINQVSTKIQVDGVVLIIDVGIFINISVLKLVL